MSYGIDVSHHQDPVLLPWATIARSSQFCIVRTSYGTMRDRRCLEHAKRARDHGLILGAYHFYRPSQPWTDQFAVFEDALGALGYGAGCLPPAIDIEDDPIPYNQLVTPVWNRPCREMSAVLVQSYGDCMVYITQRGWAMLGKPEWVLERPLWVAHYTTKPEPATPGGKPWTIWQHRVGPYDSTGPGGYNKDRPELDQNRGVDSLPLLGGAEQQPPHDDSELENLINYADFLQFEDAQNIDHFEPEDFLEDTKPDGQA